MASLSVTLPKVSTNMKQQYPSPNHKQWQSSWEHVLGTQDVKTVSVWRSCAVEMIFVALFVFCSIVICSRTEFNFLSPPVGIAFFHFLVFVIMIRAAIAPSDGQFNPAVTLSTVLAGFYSPIKGLMYIIAQSAGGILGAVFAKNLLPVYVVENNLLAGCRYKIDSSGFDVNQAFLSEFLFSFILIYVVFMVCIDQQQRQSVGLERVPLFIGLVAFFNIYVSSIIAPGYNGAYMNPARCIGPAVAFGGRELLSPLWIFWSAPALAAAAVAALYRFIPPDHRQNEQILKRKAIGKRSMPLDEEQGGTISSVAAADHGVRDDQVSIKSVY